MRQINFTYDDIHTALASLHRIRYSITATLSFRSLLHIYLSGISHHQAQMLLEEIDKILPDIPRIGISEFPTCFEPKKVSIKFNIIISDDSEFYTFYLPCKRGTEKEAANKLIQSIRSIYNVKALEICSANQEVDTHTFIETIGEEYPDIEIFGSLAKPARITEKGLQKSDDSFCLGQKIYSDGYTVIVYAGKHLEVFLNYIQSWRPIGREMSFKLEEQPLLGASGVCEIDGVPAIDVFLKYLGVPCDENFLRNSWYFPLILTRNDINICLTPIGYRGLTIYYGCRLYEDEHIQFAYCTREEIIDASIEECKKITALGPEALMLIICCNRFAFMGSYEQQEFEHYKACHSEFIYCHSYGEIAYQKKRGGMLNSALVSIVLREANKLQEVQPQSDFFSTPKLRKFSNSTIPLSFIISHFFHQMTLDLEDYQNSLEEKVKEISHENENLSLHIVQTLADTIDAKDRYTNGHSSRVAAYAKEIARRYGYKKKDVDNIYIVGLLHDVGKIGIPDYVINKKSKLTPDEYNAIKEHSVIGAHILNNIKEMPNLATGARWHHERYDGTGYPDGLKERIFLRSQGLLPLLTPMMP
ncbi:MAG: HD domain-containing protein [Desulfovibrio sp.]|nr:HD domain-containing protein [Desulfovibrio sp.]